MVYKDKEKQRKAVREAVNKSRKGITSGITGITSSGVEGITKGITSEGITSIYPEGITPGVMTEDQAERFPNIPLPFGPAYYKALAEQRGEKV